MPLMTVVLPLVVLLLLAPRMRSRRTHAEHE